MKTSVALFDAHVSVRQMLAEFLKQEEGWQVLAESASGLEAMKMLSEKSFEVVILDTALVEMSGLEVLRHVRQHAPQSRVLVYTAQMNGEIIAEAMRAWPHGYVFKHDSLEVLHEALRAVKRGCRYFVPIAAEVLDRTGRVASRWDSLTRQERTVLQMIAEGSSSKQVAGRLAISPKTVDYYRAKVMQKLELHDATALTRYAMRRGLIPLE